MRWHLVAALEHGERRLTNLSKSYDPRMGDAEQTEIKWERDNSTIEIRTQGTLANGRLALDEVVATVLTCIWKRWTMTNGGLGFKRVETMSLVVHIRRRALVRSTYGSR